MTVATGIRPRLAIRRRTLSAGPPGAGGGTRRRWPVRAKVAPVFAGAIAALLGIWVLLALLYAGIGTRTSVAVTRETVSALTGTSGRSGAIEAGAILATSEYFKATGQTAASLGLDPARDLVILVTLDTHAADLPEPVAWGREASLDANGRRLPPVAAPQVLFRSDHHQSVALSFSAAVLDGRSPAAGTPREMRLLLPPLEHGAAPALMSWTLPLNYPQASGAPLPPVAGSLGAVLAVIAGLLVVFSPCALHLTGVFLPIVTGLGMQDVLQRAQDRPFRVRLVLLGLAFVSGFVVLYTVLGVLAGFVGHLFSNTSLVRPYLVPIRLAAGGIVIYLALQSLGLFRMPFMVALQLPGRPHIGRPRHGYAAAALAGINVSVGCLACVGGTLLASLLLYAGTSGSPLLGGATLFLFSMGVSIPFLLTALAFDRLLPRWRGASRFLRHSNTVAAAVLLVVGLLILSGNEAIVEQLAPAFRTIG